MSRNSSKLWNKGLLGAVLWVLLANTGIAQTPGPLPPPTSLPPSGAAGGILSGTYPNPGFASTTGTGATVQATSPTLVTPLLGTPTSGVATNLTGTAAGLTAGTVTTNANLTGPISSTGNATAITSQTGTGTKFVVDTSPTLVTPILGVAAATTVNKVTITAPATGATLTIPDGTTLNTGTGGTLGSNAFNSTAFGTGTVTSVICGGVTITTTGTCGSPGYWNMTLSGNSGFSATTVTLVPFNTKSSGSASYCSTSTSICTPNVAGTFNVSCMATNSPGTTLVNGNLIQVLIYKNSTIMATNFLQSQVASPGIADASAIAITNIAVNGSSDTVSCKVYADAAGTLLAANGDTQFNGQYIAP